MIVRPPLHYHWIVMMRRSRLNKAESIRRWIPSIKRDMEYCMNQVWCRVDE